jgi:hypothetical protein
MPACQATPASAEVLDHVVKVTLIAWADAHPDCKVADVEACRCGRTVWLVPECPTYAPLAIATWRNEQDGPVVAFRTGLPWPSQVPYRDPEDRDDPQR